ncbi:MAG: tRNA uridine(34) 5-carboxymethylaminomethyl modification radical SAM/GNAT enzyme Elp3 [Methanosarcinales archaeon Met12]|nr:MAG: tRNA uridine(34) 5-carboxymethylaminomethyl modification radical SAM/GNAT enzyme Elp3 [Methanosarcinales archaeon Met12]
MILKGEVRTHDELNAAKKSISMQYGLSGFPKNSAILSTATGSERDIIKRLVQIKPVRTISGVAVIAVMTSPHKCPHGLCVPCPGGPQSHFQSPQSYTGYEPAALRAVQQDFDPYRQVTERLKQLKQMGHSVDKAELIVMGGTVTSRSLCYQEWFVRRCIDAMNCFGSAGCATLSLESAQAINETAKVRNVGITFETRPDWARKEHVDQMLKMGGTKVELGVQSTYDFVLKRMQRGHTVKDVIEANAVLRDSGFKVGFHMMPGLPGSDFDMDLNMFRRIFTDPKFCPDYLKIYPTLVIEGTQLYEMWQSGEYDPLTNEDAIKLICQIKMLLSKWTRLQRIQREIPAHLIMAGVTKSNIQQLVENRLNELNKRCQCIRCREVGHALLKGIVPHPEHIELKIEEYNACNGLEHFISFEESDILIGFLRLRFPHNPYRPELKDAALVRELHVYGPMVPLGQKAASEWQHRGYGEELLKCAEELALDAGFSRIAIISGIGVREYYKKLGYERDGPYMVKLQ